MTVQASHTSAGPEVWLIDPHQPRLPNEKRPWLDVAVGILFNPQGEFLMATRPTGKAYAGYWEFPGGKVEAGESVEQALARELHEELLIELVPSHVLRWKWAQADYPHARVRLHFCKVYAWSGQPQAQEGQVFSWTTAHVKLEPILPATQPVLTWLAQELDAASGRVKSL